MHARTHTQTHTQTRTRIKMQGTAQKNLLGEVCAILGKRKRPMQKKYICLHSKLNFWIWDAEEKENVAALTNVLVVDKR